MLEQTRALARYNQWMNQKLYALTATLSDEERKQDRGAFFGSIHRTLNHILLADRTWMLRLTGDHEHFVSRDATGQEIALTSLGQELYADFAELTKQRETTDRQILSWANGLEADALSRDMSYRNTKGEPQGHITWWAILHFFNHQTHHRGQVTTLLMQAGKDPGVTDLIYMLRSE